MNVTCIKIGNGYAVVNDQNDIVGVLEHFRDSWKVDRSKSLKIDSQVSAKVGD